MSFDLFRDFTIFDQKVMLFIGVWSKSCFCSATSSYKELPHNHFGFSASQRHNRVPWTALLSFLCITQAFAYHFLIKFESFSKLPLHKNDFGFSASQRHNRVPWNALFQLPLHQLLAKPPIAAAVWAKPTWISIAFGSILDPTCPPTLGPILSFFSSFFDLKMRYYLEVNFQAC